MSKFYITGSSGFVGSHICNYLQSNGHNVVKHYRNKQFSMVWNVRECDTVINCQSYGNLFDQTDVYEMLKANVINLYDLQYECENVQKLYNISSSSIHLKVQTPYSLTKQLGEHIVNSYNNPNFVNVRPYTIFGEGDNELHLIPTIIRHLRSGEPMQLVEFPTHDYIYIHDFINAMFEGFTEIGTGIKTTNLQIVQMLEFISDKKLNYIKVDKMRDYDNDNWVCPTPVKHIDLYEALKQTYDRT